MSDGHHFTTVVFAGGGSRCVWQVGLWEELAPVLKTAPDTVAAVSAGAAMACFIFSGCGPEALDYFKEITAKNPRNFYPGNLMNGRPVFPHLEMYRGTLLKFLTRERLRRLHQGPDVRILMARPPVWAGPGLAVLCGYLCYQIEKSLSAPLHPVLAEKIGFRPMVGQVRECGSPERLADLILASSCTPPFTPVLRWRGEVVLDGGLIDNVPKKALPHRSGRTLYLL
ncbi:MAG: Patatin, partial [Betaproteobacteria bacterium HGW-Betaproteobacteria-18]